MRTTELADVEDGITTLTGLCQYIYIYIDIHTHTYWNEMMKKEVGFDKDGIGFISKHQ